MNYDMIIGVDPDSVKSGVACVDVHTRRVECMTLTFADVLEYLAYVKGNQATQGYRYLVVVEAGWLNENNWHLRWSDNLHLAAAKGRSLGRCEQTGRLILEMAEHMGLNCVARKPLRKCWRGKDRKITHDEIKQITGVMGRTNQESRDALLLAWVEANFPIKVKYP